MCFRGARYGLLSDFVCREKISSKHLIPLKPSSKSLCSYFVVSAFPLPSSLSLGSGRKYSISILLSAGMNALLLFIFELLPVFA